MTAPDSKVAEQLAQTLVTEQFAACVNLVPQVRSIYEWEGKLVDDTEVLLIAKASTDKVDALTAKVKAMHPYSVPEVITLEVSQGNSAYLGWVLGARASP